MAIGSINQAISFLGSTGTSAREPISPIANRRSSERPISGNTTQPTDAFEAALSTHFSQAALERANRLTHPYNEQTQDLSEAKRAEVQIDVSPIERDPEATIRNTRQVQRAARAGANPSGTDLAIAAAAVKQEASARVELRQGKRRGSEELTGRRATAPSVPAAYRTSNDDRSGGLLNLLA